MPQHNLTEADSVVVALVNGFGLQGSHCDYSLPTSSRGGLASRGTVIARKVRPSAPVSVHERTDVGSFFGGNGITVEDVVCPLLADHDGRRLGVATDERRHD